MKFDGYESTNLSSRLSSWEWTESVLTIGLKRKYALKKQELSIVKHKKNLVRGLKDQQVGQEAAEETKLE